MILRDGRNQLRDVGPSYARTSNRRGAAIPAVRLSDGIAPQVKGYTARYGGGRTWRETASIEAMG